MSSSLSSYSIGDGMMLKMTFTESLLSTFSGNDSHLYVEISEYDRVPEGTLTTQRKSIYSIYSGSTAYELLVVMNDSFKNAVGSMHVIYDGHGTLQGFGGPVQAFDYAFTPVNLSPLNMPHDPEHIELQSFSLSYSLPQIMYIDSPITKEHVELVGFSLTELTMTHISDL